MACVSPIELTGSYKGLVKPLHFIKYIYLRFRLSYLISLTLLIRYSSLPSTLTSGGGCNRLPIYRQNANLTRLHIDSLTDSVTNSVK